MTTQTTNTQTPDLVVGAWYRIRGSLGTFKLVKGPNKDGSWDLYGGEAGHGGTRCVMPERILPENRKQQKAVQTRLAARQKGAK